MIPKIIHYCWFGKNKYPDIVKKCIAGWQKHCPDYEIKLWNEGNYDIAKNPYLQEAYQTKKWAFVSDLARLDIIYQHGGIYLDTDVELVKSLDDLLAFDAFVAADGSGINTGLGFGATAHHPTIKEMRDLYNGKHFITTDGPDLTPCTQMNTYLFLKEGYDINTKQVINLKNVTILPPEYFSPIGGKYSELLLTPNTYGIHWNSRLWETGITRLKAKGRLLLGAKIVNKLKKIFK
ncbi:MAG: glycosyl transferase [Elusimicrobiaceae bacterium]|nr:glycosyl transferase [Elusimicrobiaceae bacterium]